LEQAEVVRQVATDMQKCQVTVENIMEAVGLEKRDNVKPLHAFDDEREIRSLCQSLGAVNQKIRIYCLETADIRAQLQRLGVKDLLVKILTGLNVFAEHVCVALARKLAEQQQKGGRRQHQEKLSLETELIKSYGAAPETTRARLLFESLLLDGYKTLRILLRGETADVLTKEDVQDLRLFEFINSFVSVHCRGYDAKQAADPTSAEKVFVHQNGGLLDPNTGLLISCGTLGYLLLW
jgi:hypothetical protein